MNDLSFTTEYLPQLEDLSDEQLLTARSLVVEWMSSNFTGVDSSPGTVFGDGVVTPIAGMLAAVQEATRRMLSDMNTANVADGRIYSCEFVRRFLANLGVYDVDGAKTSGILRLTFDADASLTIPGRVRFLINGSQFSVRIPVGMTEIQLLQSGSMVVSENDYVLRQTSVNTWAVDIPIEATETASAADSGTSASVSETVAGLRAATLVTPLAPGNPPASLSALARFAQRATAASNSVTKDGIRSLILRMWPYSSMVAVFNDSDPESTRSVAGGPLALSAPAVDVCYRSSADMSVISQTIRLDFYLLNGTTPRFRGALQLLHRPSKIVSVIQNGGGNENLVSAAVCYSFNAAPARFAGHDYFGSEHEGLLLDVHPALLSGASRIRTITDSSGTYAWFTVTYLADPWLSSVTRYVEADSRRIPGVDVMVRGGPLVELTNLTITYTKTPGVKMAAAAQNIASMVNASGYPSPLRALSLADLVRAAGAASVNNITATFAARNTPADKLLLDEFPPADAYEFWGSEWNALDAAELTGSAVNQFSISETAYAEGWSVTERNARFYVKPENVNLVEQHL